MAYRTMTKLIENENTKLENEEITVEAYAEWKTATQNKLDVFLSCGRITDAQYEELNKLLK